MSLIIPREEIQKLISLILESFYYQLQIKITNDNLYFNFIHPRAETVIGVQINTLLPNRYLKLRVYIESFDIVGSFDQYRIEQIINKDNGLDDYTYVSLARLPSAIFPALYLASKDPNTIPDFERDSVENPSGSDELIISTPISDSGTLLYLTTPPYPAKAQEQLSNQIDVLRGGKIGFLTSSLYPVRGNEIFQSKAIVSGAKKYRPPIINDGLDIDSLLEQFILGISPYVGNSYYYTPENGRQYEELSIDSILNLFTLIQTYFPIYYTELFPTGIDFEAFTASAVLTNFTLT